MIYMGIDPAYKKSHAYSIWANGALVEVGKFDFMCELWSLLHKYSVDTVLLEDQYLNKSFDTAKKMTFRSGMIAGICEYLSVHVEIVNVATWTSRAGVYEGMDKKLSVYKRKKEKIKRLMRHAKFFGFVVEDEDIAVAILIPYAMKIRSK